MYPQLKDENLTLSLTLPNGANTTTNAGLQIQPAGSTGVGREFVADVEAIIEIPALTTGQLPDTQTITYSIEMSDAAGFGSGVIALGPTKVQTGAGGAGAAADTLRVRLPSNALSYVRAKAVKTGAADASAVSAKLRIVA